MERKEMDPRYFWKLEDIFPSNEAWEEEYTSATEKIDAVAAFYGRVAESAETLFALMEAGDKLGMSVEKLFTYARMRRDEDNGSAHYQAMVDRAMTLMVKAESATAFIEPQLLAAPDGVIEGYIASYAPLAAYRFDLFKTLRRKPHTLSEDEEKLLAMAGDVLNAPDTIYSMLTDADMELPMVPGEDGEQVRLSHGNYGTLLQSRDRAVRRAAYEGMYSAYKALKNTIAASYAANVKADIFMANAHKFSSPLEAAMFGNDIPRSVYMSLIEAMHQARPMVAEYLELRKKLLGLDELHYYDLYVPLFSFEDSISYEQAQAFIAEALAPLGKEYLDDSAHAFTDGWVDVYENKGKTSGAYSWGCYGSHPYMLLNHQDNLDGMFTLAHELGHSMHSFYSDKSNPYNAAQYPIFLAEIASTTNEVLLIRHKIEKASSDDEKKFLLNHLMEMFRTTMYRQTMFAEFELKAHEMAASGGALTPESLSGLYRQLNEDYYPGVVMDDFIPYEWSRIPHFYRAFYVYQYATGLAAAVKFAGDILGSEEAAGRYLDKFLSAGGRDFPIETLKSAGVDMTSAATVGKAVDFFRTMLAELKQML